MLERVYMAGVDEIPWQTRARWQDEQLVVERSESDSGNLFVPLEVAGHGQLVLSTASLMERSRPYHLDVELRVARSIACSTRLPDGKRWA